MIKANKLVGSCVNQENLLTKKENKKANIRYVQYLQ